MGEPWKRERLGFLLSPLLPVCLRESTKLDQPRLLRMQFQTFFKFLPRHADHSGRYLSFQTEVALPRFQCGLTAALAGLGARVARYSFPVRLFHPVGVLLSPSFNT